MTHCCDTVYLNIEIPLAIGVLLQLQADIELLLYCMKRFLHIDLYRVN